MIDPAVRARDPALSRREDARANRTRTTLFAAQAEIPAGRHDREQILLTLADCPQPVVKLRATDGEPQTHRETWAYPQLAAGLGLTAGQLDVRSGPLGRR